MASVNQPFGMNPIRHLNGKFIPNPRAMTIASGYGTDIFYGAPVILNTNGTIVAGTTNADIVGVFAGVQFIRNNSSLFEMAPNWTAGTTYVAGTCVAWVWDDPNTIYQIQSNGSLAATSVGDQADFVNPGVGSATTGRSTATISSTLAGAGAQAQLRIVGLDQRIDNAWGDSFTIVEAQIARHQYIANKVAV